MKKDLYVAEEVRTEKVYRNIDYPTKVKPEVADESVDDSFDLPIPPDFPLPDAAFAFPQCRVSSSTLELLQLVKSVSTQYYTIITRKDMISCQNCISFLGMD